MKFLRRSWLVAGMDRPGGIVFALAFTMLVTLAGGHALTAFLLKGSADTTGTMRVALAPDMEPLTGPEDLTDVTLVEAGEDALLSVKIAEDGSLVGRMVHRQDDDALRSPLLLLDAGAWAKAYSDDVKRRTLERAGRRYLDVYQWEKYRAVMESTDAPRWRWTSPGITFNGMKQPPREEGALPAAEAPPPSPWAKTLDMKGLADVSLLLRSIAGGALLAGIVCQSLVVMRNRGRFEALFTTRIGLSHIMAGSLMTILIAVVPTALIATVLVPLATGADAFEVASFVWTQVAILLIAAAACFPLSLIASLLPKRLWTRIALSIVTSVLFFVLVSLPAVLMHLVSMLPAFVRFLCSVGPLASICSTADAMQWVPLSGLLGAISGAQASALSMAVSTISGLCLIVALLALCKKTITRVNLCTPH